MFVLLSRLLKVERAQSRTGSPVSGPSVRPVETSSLSLLCICTVTPLVCLEGTEQVGRN